ncbi:MAG: response regulator [Casimicrobium sp.]
MKKERQASFLASATAAQAPRGELATPLVRTPAYARANTAEIVSELMSRLSIDSSEEKKPARSKRASSQAHVLVIEHQPLMREALANVLAAQAKPACATTIQNVHEAKLHARVRFDLILLDLNLPGYSNLDCLTAMKTLRPDTPIVALASTDDQSTVRAAIDAGAMGFISKRYDGDLIAHAVGVVLGGDVFLPPMDDVDEQTPPHEFRRRASDRDNTLAGHTQRRRASDRLLTEPPPPLNLTPRQMQVLALLVKGLCNKSICRQLSLSENTVKSHITAIFRSLGVNSRTSVVIAISERGYHLPKI